VYDTLIIGAGMSGLAAGIRLAHFGKRVCVLERHTTVGGLNSFYRLGGRNYDVGLHALTNYAPRGANRGPLVRILRQLRMDWDDWQLAPQLGSTIAFPGVRLDFTNDFEQFRSEILRHFPDQKDGLDRLVAGLAGYGELGQPGTRRSARQAVSEWIREPLLVEMLFCPIQFYGSARQHDLDFGLFSILFRSIFLEGFARPLAGTRRILRNLVRKFKASGGELRLRAGVRQIAVDRGRAAGVVLEDGSQLPARTILSSAGFRETMLLCDPALGPLPPTGDISFVESICSLDALPRTLGLDRAILFFNDSPRFSYARPDELVDVRSGVVCVPNNFDFEEPMRDGWVRLTALANYDRWAQLDPEAYGRAKRDAYERMAASAARFVPDFRPSVAAIDTFTPTTIFRYTGHLGGAVYGSPEKCYDGRTRVENLYLCGTDQGYVGIVGSILSGISIANRYLLKDEGRKMKDKG
jgi:phytoene dehydrogenase-like protein